MFGQNPFSAQKQGEAKVKVKETDPTCGQILFFPVTTLHPSWAGFSSAP